VTHQLQQQEQQEQQVLGHCWWQVLQALHLLPHNR
jgi:hypothetical protein